MKDKTIGGNLLLNKTKIAPTVESDPHNVVAANLKAGLLWSLEIQINRTILKIDSPC